MTCKDCLNYEKCCERDIHILLYGKWSDTGYKKRYICDYFIDKSKFLEKKHSVEIDACIDHLEMLKAEIEWEHPIGYQTDLDFAINKLKELNNG